MRPQPAALSRSPAAPHSPDQPSSLWNRAQTETRLSPAAGPDDPRPAATPPPAAQTNLQSLQIPFPAAPSSLLARSKATPAPPPLQSGAASDNAGSASPASQYRRPRATPLPAPA